MRGTTCIPFLPGSCRLLKYGIILGGILPSLFASVFSLYVPYTALCLLCIDKEMSSASEALTMTLVELTTVTSLEIKPPKYDTATVKATTKLEPRTNFDDTIGVLGSDMASIRLREITSGIYSRRHGGTTTACWT